MAECDASFLASMSADHLSRQFGAMMNVEISNDGPVTIVLDSNDGPAPPAPKNLEIAAEKTRKKKEAALARREAASKEQE